MNDQQGREHHVDLQAIATSVAEQEGFSVDPPGPGSELPASVRRDPPDVRDERKLLWSSIDNRESTDLDQVEVSERLPDGSIRIRIGIADVDSDGRKDLVVQLEDIIGALDQTNLPGTTTQHPNWRRKLGLSLEQVDRLTKLLQKYVADGRSTPGAPQKNTIDPDIMRGTKAANIKKAKKAKPD